MKLRKRTETGPRKKARKKVTTKFLLTAYDAFLRESELGKIAAVLDTQTPTLLKWLEKFPELKLARKMAEEKRSQTSSLGAYVYQHLSEEAKKTWDQIMFWKESECAEAKVRRLLGGKPTKFRQELFLHALVNFGFNLSEACRYTDTSRQTLERWRSYDLEFQQMVEEIEWHKKNFLEHALLDLVAIRNPAAVIYANRTKNKDRGYNEKIEIEHTGSIGLGFTIEQLNLPIETRKQILAAVREKQEEKQQEDYKQLAEHSEASQEAIEV